MSIKITIPNTSSDTLTFGSANTPTAAQIAGIDSGSSNGQLAIYTTTSGTSTERVRVDASGNVGIGTASPRAKVDVNGSIYTGWADTNFIGMQFGSDPSGYRLGLLPVSSTRDLQIQAKSSDGFSVSGITFHTGTGPTERMRIDSVGNLLVGKTGTDNTTTGVAWQASGAGNSVTAGGAGDGPQIQVVNTTASGTAPNGFRYLSFRLGATATEIGTITKASATTVAYNTSSDYRLKYDVAPMTGALEKVKQLKPCTYKWHEDDSDGEGFIAHELAEVCPYAVTGKKDAVNEDGSIKSQGIDTSFLVATLTAAIQEQQALITALTARITALENK